MEIEIMVIKHLVMNAEKSDQGKGITIGFCFCQSKMSKEMIDRIQDR
jgi:hypothetical protein